MLAQMFRSYAMGTFRGVEEAAVALVVGLIMLTWAKVIPDWEWETFKWREMVRFVLSLLASYTIFAGVCYGGLEIPGMNPACGVQGAFNALIVGFLAFLVNEYTEDKALNFVDYVRSKRKK